MIIIPNKKQMVTAILGPDGENVGDRRDLLPESYDSDSELSVIAQELIEAVHARNVDDTKAALRAAFECLDSEPHEEGPDEDDAK